MIYLDSAATTMPKPPEVYAAVSDALVRCGSLGRSGHEAALLAAELAYACRAQAGRIFDAAPEQVVFTMNATHALNLAIFSLVQPGDRVVVSGFEHNAVMRPLHSLGAEVIVAESPLFDQEAAFAAFERAVIPGTKAVVCSHVSNVFGFVQPLEAISALCRERGVDLIVDAAQSAGVLPLSLRKSGAAFLAMPGHKGLYGPMGTGLLLCGKTPRPLLQGGTGSLSRSLEMPDFLPDRAEAGTQNMPGIAGLLEGLRFLERRGIAEIDEHERTLKKRLVKALEPIPGLIVYSNENAQTGVVSFRAEGADCETLGSCLAEAGFAVRAGLHCAPLAHQTAGTLDHGTVRVSFSAFNEAWEVDRFAEAVWQLMQKING